MVVASRMGSGCTTTAALLAATLAEGRRSRVLIIDGNFRTPSLNMVFNCEDNGGFHELLSEDVPFDSHIQQTDRENLFVLTTGRGSIVPSELFEGDGIKQLIVSLKQNFEYIIFDGAPLLDYPDSYALAPKVDGIILVVHSEKTPIGDAVRVKRDLERAGGRLLGVVLNRQKDYTPAFLKKLFRNGN
jgi:capsular exopolysaccharide synthesis family protein